MKLLSLITVASLVTFSYVTMALSTAAFAGDKKPIHKRGGDRHEMVKKMDTNKDGSISKQEFQAQHSAKFAGFDTNNDKSVSLEEFKAHMAKMQEERKKAMAAKRAARMKAKEAKQQERMKKAFEGFDANGDGRISEAEYTARGERTFIRMDRNDDGVVNKDDHRRKMKQMHKKREMYKKERMAHKKKQMEHSEKDQ